MPVQYSLGTAKESAQTADLFIRQRGSRRYDPLDGGLDGLDIAARIKADQELRNIWVIAVTASAMQGDRERFLSLGCDDYLSKPFEMRELLVRVDGFFERQGRA